MHLALHPRTETPCHLFLLLVGVALAGAAPAAHAAPVVGFVESFPGTSLGSWTSGNNVSNPGAGGALGAGDGYLFVSTPGFNSNLGAVGIGTEYVGDWTAAGANRVRVQLNDVDADHALEIHFGIGTMTNFWQYDIGFMPPENAWAEYTVDLSAPGSFTRIIGTGTFAAALSGADRVLLRHDRAPYVQAPDTLNADFGLDEFTIAADVAGVAPVLPHASRVVELARPWPNPSRGPVALSLRSATADPVRIEIVDVTGRAVRHATLAAGAGERVWIWDGLDDGGAPAPAGYYRARAFGPGGGTSRPLVRLAR
jgi:hypothetical protein